MPPPLTKPQKLAHSIVYSPPNMPNVAMEEADRRLHGGLWSRLQPFRREATNHPLTCPSATEPQQILDERELAFALFLLQVTTTSLPRETPPSVSLFDAPKNVAGGGEGARMHQTRKKGRGFYEDKLQTRFSSSLALTRRPASLQEGETFFKGRRSSKTFTLRALVLIPCQARADSTQEKTRNATNETQNKPQE